jgi:hypothetical protein
MDDVLGSTPMIWFLCGLSGQPEAPDWSARISLANPPDDVYDDGGRVVRAVACPYVKTYHYTQTGGCKP